VQGTGRERQVDLDFRFEKGSVRAALFGALMASALGCGPALAQEAADDLEHLRPLINQTLETEKSGIEIGWSNPATGHSGTLRVERTFHRGQQPCREYLRTLERPGAAALVTRGIGCRVGRAQWEIKEEGTTAQALLPEPGVGPVELGPDERKAAEKTAEALAAARACPDPAPLPSAKVEPAPAPFAAFTLPARSDI
jgi:surface antigen